MAKINSLLAVLTKSAPKNSESVSTESGRYMIGSFLCRIEGYLPGKNKYLGCRECYELTYESRQRHRERFYETFEKPYQKWQRTIKKFMKARSPERVMQLKDEMNRLMAIIHGKDSFLNFRYKGF